MTFEVWLKKQIGRNDLVGDLAEDFISARKLAPHRGSKCDEGHLTMHNACAGAFDALKQARLEWASYAAQANKKKK